MRSTVNRVGCCMMQPRRGDGIKPRATARGMAVHLNAAPEGRRKASNPAFRRPSGAGNIFARRFPRAGARGFTPPPLRG